jgi:hypothetical protein
MHQSLVIKLKKTKRVLRLLEKDGLRDSKLLPIVLTNKIYDESEFKEIENYFYRKYAEVNLENDEDATKKRAEFLEENLNLPRGLKFTDVGGFLNHLNPYKKLKNDSNINAGVAMERFILAVSKKHNLLNVIPAKNNRVYAIQLNDGIKENQSFLKHNPNIDMNKPAFYIGQTSKNRKERYDEHKKGVRSNRFARNFGLEPYEAADKTYELAELFDVPVDDLRHYQALYYELKLTLLLQENGYGAYSN